jgi:hypothetical protein
VSASAGSGGGACSNSPSRFPSGRSRRLRPWQEAVGELAVEMDIALLEESDNDSSLIFVRSGRSTWCCGTARVTLMAPVDLEKGYSSIGVVALRRVMEEGESKEKDCGRMRTFGLGVRGGTVRKVAMMVLCSAPRVSETVELVRLARHRDYLKFRGKKGK